jgi:hypothetical protein
MIRTGHGFDETDFCVLRGANPAKLVHVKTMSNSHHA